MKKEYCVTCVTFENEKIDGTKFESPLYSVEEYLTYKPTIEEIKKAYGKGWEYVKKIVITTMSETAKTSDDFIEEEYTNEDY